MNLADLKLYTINSVTLGVTMMDIEWWLKIILLLESNPEAKNPAVVSKMFEFNSFGF